MVARNEQCPRGLLQHLVRPLPLLRQLPAGAPLGGDEALRTLLDAAHALREVTRGVAERGSPERAHQLAGCADAFARPAVAAAHQRPRVAVVGKVRPQRDADCEERRCDEPKDDSRADDTGLVIGPTTGDADVTVAPRGRAARGSTHRDAEIARDVSRRLGEHASLDASDVDVHVKDGRVTLEGRVQDPPARHVAELIADAVPGVRAVDNRLDTSRG